MAEHHHLDRQEDVQWNPVISDSGVQASAGGGSFYEDDEAGKRPAPS